MKFLLDNKAFPRLSQKGRKVFIACNKWLQFQRKGLVQRIEELDPQSRKDVLEELNELNNKQKTLEVSHRNTVNNENISWFESRMIYNMNGRVNRP